MSDNYIPWWVPNDHPMRGGDGAPVPDPVPPVEVVEEAPVADEVHVATVFPGGGAQGIPQEPEPPPVTPEADATG